MIVELQIDLVGKIGEQFTYFPLFRRAGVRYLGWEIGKLSPYFPAQSYLDIGFSFSFPRSFEIDGGVSNVLDNDPPMLAGHGTQSNSSPEWYDPFGRRYFIGVTWRQ